MKKHQREAILKIPGPLSEELFKKALTGFDTGGKFFINTAAKKMRQLDK